MLLSAIMPAFNAERFVGHSVTSIRNQTVDEWELVIVDDGSTDRTSEVCSGLATQDCRIKLFSYPHAGRAIARNRCLAHAAGDVIVVCDADDVSFPERFKTHLDHFNKIPNLGISTAPVQIVFSDEMDIERMYYFKYELRPDRIRRRFAQNKMAISNSSSAIASNVFRRHGSFDPRLHRCQDYEFYKRVINHVDVVCDETPLVMYRENQSLPRWSYFWESREYHWMVDNFHLGSNSSCELSPENLPNRGVLYHLITSLRFGKYLSRRVISRQRGLTTRDRQRVLRLIELLRPSIES